MKLASLAVARGERHLSLVREPATGARYVPPDVRYVPPAARYVAALPAWRRLAGAVLVVIALGVLTVGALTWSLMG